VAELLGITALVRGERKGEWIDKRLLDTPDSRGRTPLFLATLFGHTQIVQLLLNFGSDSLEVPSCSGRTPLSFAEAVMVRPENVDEEGVGEHERFRYLLELLRSPRQAANSKDCPSWTYAGYFYDDLVRLECGSCHVRIYLHDYAVVCSECPSGVESHGLT
jgi:hypothetical protein